MSETRLISRRVGAAADFIDSRLAEGRVAFPLRELVEKTGLSTIAAKNQLLRLGRRVVRVSRPQQFFLIVSPEHRIMGAPPALWWLDDYFKWLGHPYYLALQSAAGIYGSNAQALQVNQVMTDRPRREISVGRIRFQFFVKRRIKNTPMQMPPFAFSPVNISTPEATLFDLIRYAPGIGGMNRAIETLLPLLPRVRFSKLKQLLELENETSTVQRLGYVVEKVGNKKLATAIHGLLPSQIPTVLLVSLKSGRASSTVNPRWRIIDNAEDFAL